MIAKAMEKFKEMTGGKVHEIGGEKWFGSGNSLEMIREPIDYPDELMINTLTGLKDYVGIEMPPEGSFFHVAGCRSVMLIAGLNEREERSKFIRSQVIDNSSMISDWMELDQFIVLLNTMFVHGVEGDTNIETIAGVLSHIKEQKTTDFEDSGLNQNISMKNTLKPGAEAIKAEIPNPLKLRPYRTFCELEQPQSQFVMRLRRGNQGPQVALFESKSNLWKIEAIQSIKSWLQENVPEFPVIA